MNQKPNTPKKAESPRPWQIVAGLAGLFCIAIIATLFFQHATATVNDPWKSPQIVALHEKLVKSPKDEQIKAQIRALDLKYRQRFFRRLNEDETGGFLLLAGAGLFLYAINRAKALHGVLPMPEWKPMEAETSFRRTTHARLAVATFGVIVFAGFAVAAPIILKPSQTDKMGDIATSDTGNKAETVPSTAIAWQSEVPPQSEFQANWPRFRGPDGSGFSPKGTAPLEWDESAKKNVLWKSEIPLPGFNSPIVWGNRVFVSGATAEKREVYCYDTTDGKLVWKREVANVPGSPAKPIEVFDQTGFAASTMATDGRRVYAIFANGDLAALAFDGTVVWSKNLGVPKNSYGHASSLAVWQGRLIVQLDQGEGDPAGSKLILYDGATGKVVWEKQRKVPGSWASPIVVEAARKTQIVTAALPSVISYDFKDGSEIWRANILEGDVAPSPIFVGNFFYVVNPSNKLFAIKADSTGEITEEMAVWNNSDDVPDVSSPTSNGELVFQVTSGGMLGCFDSKDGKKLWEHDFSTEVQASPGIAGNRLYVVSTDGHAWVLEAGREYKELGSGSLDDKFLASPAFSGGRIYLRGNSSLYCIGEK